MKKRHIVLAIIAVTFALLLVTGCSASGAAVHDGDTVQVNYTGKLVDGTVFDTSVGLEPLEFTIGSGQVIPGFEKAIIGMKVGEKKTFTVVSDEAYGPRFENLTTEISRDKIPSGIVPKVGLQLQATQANGDVVLITIIKVTDTMVTIDGNHPLAGKDLTFEIELLKIL